VGKPQVARNNRKLQFLFVNTRPVHDYVVSKQVRDAFGTLLPRDMQPVFALYVHVDPRTVDVNVHPRKTEVRFAEPQQLYQAIYRAVADALDHTDLVKQPAAPTLPHAFPASVSRSLGDAPKTMSAASWLAQAPRPSTSPEIAKLQQPVSQAPLFIAEAPVPVSDSSTQRILGQIHCSYIVVEAAEGLRVYDQHAVSERVNYERLKKEWLSDTLKKQTLLLPQTIELATIEANLIRLNQELFEKLGFELSELSNNSFLLNAVPQMLMDKDFVAVIKEIVGQIESRELGHAHEWKTRLNEPLERVFKMMACRSAVMFGDTLAMEKMQQLLDQLQAGDNKFTCVHGRPCVIEYTHDALARLFKRQ
jgi:DNA mismatch repair protein MutL